MNYIITGRNIEVTPKLREQVEQGLSPLHRFLQDEASIRVVLSEHGEDRKVEVTIPTHDMILRSEQVSNNWDISIDLTCEVIKRQIRKFRHHIIAREESGEDFIEELSALTDTVDSEEIRIVRSKRFNITPLDPEDACIQMELLGHAFFVFNNIKTGKTNVVYRRKDGSYGLIEPED